MKIQNGKVKGNRKKFSTKYGPVVARCKTCLHPHWVRRKTPSYPKNTAAQVINCAFMPTDADTVNIHVRVWIGPAEAWMREALIEIVLLLQLAYIALFTKMQCAICRTEPLVIQGC